MNRQSISPERITLNLMLILLLLPIHLNAQTDKRDSLAQYLFPSFSRGTVKTKNGTVYTLLLNYNIVTEKMVFEQKGKYFDLANPEAVDTAFLRKGKFVPRDEYFLEVIVDGKVSVFKRNKGELIAPPRSAGYGTTTDLTSSNLLEGIATPQGYYNFKLPVGYTIRPASSFWARKDDKWTRFTSENQFVKIFPQKEKELKQFIRENNLRISRMEDMIRIGNYCNEIIK
jgi:hypothetical protein